MTNYPNISTSHSATLIDRKQLSNRWTTSIATLKRLEKAGVLSPVAISERVIRYRISDIEQIEANSAHGSDSAENAAIEIAYFFSETEIVG